MKNDLLHPARPDATRSESDAATAAAAAASGDDAVTAAVAPVLPPEDNTGFPEGAAAPGAGSADTAADSAPGTDAAKPQEGGEPPLPPSTTAEDAPARSEPPSPPATPGGMAPTQADADDSADKTMSLMDHLAELRTRLVRCCIAVIAGFFVCWAVVDPLYNALVDPLLAVLPPGSHAQYTTLPEGFFTRMYIAFIAGVFLTSPILFYQIWAFISPGLYEEEKRGIVPIAFMSAVFFAGGGAFCYFIVFPYAFAFFVSFATESIVVTPKISDYLDFVLKLILAFGLVFEMPLFSFFLSRMGVVTAARLRSWRRYAVLLIFIAAAILTPPDVVSQLLMACPMLLLYEVSILVAAAAGKKPGPRAAAKAAAASDTTTPPEGA